MKTTIFMVMATLMLASCSKNEVSEGMPTANDPNKISFNSSTGVTRAVDNGLTQVQGGFNVLGFKNGIAEPFIGGTAPAAEYKFTASKWSWTDVIGKEWPTVIGEYPLTFYAEFPQVDMAPIKSTLNKVIEVPLAMVAQTDYLVAQSIVANRPPTGFAPLNFKHILSNLVFQIKTAKDYTVYIQSIRIVNTATKGRTFDYATMKYGAETAYADLATTDGTYNTAEGFFFSKPATPWSFKADQAAAEQVGIVTAESGIMMQMPQMTLAYWTATNMGNGLGKFTTDATAWKNGSETDAATKLAAWYGAETNAAPQPGMKLSKGWEGTRIEVIYRIEDKDSKSVIGRKSGDKYTDAAGAEKTATKDYFVRVGFPLDLSQIKNTETTPVAVGWEMSKRYTYTISLGTVDATNGILLDPDYKDNAGASDTPKIPVENPKTDPGTPVTPAGLIGFDVAVDNWEDNAQSIK